MRVLLVNDSAPGRKGTGGVETHVRQLHEALVEHGTETTILASQPRGHPEMHTAHELLIPNFKAPPLRKHFLKNYRQHQVALKRAFNFIEMFKPDVIHIHNLMDSGALRMLRSCGPVVKSIHDCRPFCIKPYPVVASRLIGNSETFCERTFGPACWKHCYAHAGETPMQRIESWSYFQPNLNALHEIVKTDQLIVYSHYLKELALRKSKDAQRIHVVQLFTAAEQAASSAAPKPAGIPRFLFAGRLSPEKGILKIFDALDRIPQVPVKLTIAGGGPLRSAVHERIKRSHPLHDIEMTGYLDQPQLYEYYHTTSVLLFPSIGSEGCPLSGIEAMYFGSTAIGFDTGGIEEWLINEKTGILLPRGDVGGLADTIEELSAAPQRIAQMGHQAQQYVQKKFTRTNHIDQLLKTYRAAIQTRAASTTRTNG